MAMLSRIQLQTRSIAPICGREQDWNESAICRLLPPGGHHKQNERILKGDGFEIRASRDRIGCRERAPKGVGSVFVFEWEAFSVELTM